MDYNTASLELHKRLQGKIEINLKTPIKDAHDLSVVYSPGVGAPCMEIQKDVSKAKKYTLKGNTIAIVSDGSAVLGLGNIGPEASLPVMEGKSALFKEFADVNCFPIVLDTQDTEEIIQTIKHIAPGFGGIAIEDISAPRCFEIENRLKAELDIPVFHDDQHGTAIVCLAGLINSLKIVGKKKEDIKVVVNGVGASGVAIINLLLHYGIKNIVAVDSSGAIYPGRKNLNSVKETLTKVTNIAGNGKSCITGGLAEAIKGADVFLGVSVAGLLTKDMVKSMNKDAIIFALANPNPEITPEEAYQAGAKIVSTGRSDYPNQINNVLVFPGIFRGALDNGITRITKDIKISAAESLAGFVKNPSPEKIIPSPFEKGIVELIAASIK